MFPWGRRGSASQAAGGDGLHHHKQDRDSVYINNKYDEDDILGAMKEIHYNNNHSYRLSNNVSSFHPTDASRYNVGNSHSNSNGQAGNEHGPSRSNRSSQRYSHLRNSNGDYGHYEHQQHDSVQSIQQFYHLHLDLTATSGGEYQEQQQGIYGYVQSPRTPDRDRERKVVVNRTSMDDQMDESEGQYSPPPPSRSATGAASSSLSTLGTEIGTCASSTQQQQRTVSNSNDNNNEGGNDNNSPTTTIINKTLAKLTNQDQHHTYSDSLASSTTSSISSSSSSSSSPSTVVSTTTSPVQHSPSSSPSPSSQTPQTPQTPPSRMSSPTATPFLSSPLPSTSGSSSGRYNTTTVINTTTALDASTGALESPTTSSATASPTATVATSKTLSSPSSSTSSSTLNNRHSLHSFPGGGSPSSSSSSMVTMKTKAFEGGVNFNKKMSSPSSRSSPLSIYNSPPRPLSLQQYRQEYQVSRPMTVHLNASHAVGGSGVGGKRRSLLLRMENACPMEDTDRQGNLMMPAMAAINGAFTSGRIAGARTGTGVSTIASAGGGGVDGGNRGGGDGMMEFGGMLNAEDDGDNEDRGPEPYYVFSVPHWETVKAGLLPTSKPARDALLATIVLALITIALEAVLLHRHKVMTASLTGSAPTSTESSGGGGGMSYEISFFRPLTVYYFIFILAEIFAVGLLWDAAIHKNSLQLVAFTLFEWCMVSYSGLQIWQHDQLVKAIGIPAEALKGLGDKTTQMILFSQLGVQIAACLGITLLTWRLYSEFRWLVFQKLGADVSLRKMMKEYRLLFTLLKLDAFFFFGYAIQVAALTDKHWQKGLEEIAFAIPLSGIIILLGFCALRNENKVTMGGFISCLGLLIAYMIYRLVALYQTLTGDALTDPYFFSRKTMTVFAALTLFMTVLALVYAVVMLYNFNKGLKEAMQQYRVRRSGTIRSVTPSTPRMSVNGGYGVSATGLRYSQHGLGGDVGVVGAGGKRLSNHHQSGGMSGMVGLGSGFGGGSGGSVGGDNRGGGGGGKSSKRVSRRSILHCEPVVAVPAMVERWPIE